MNFEAGAADIDGFLEHRCAPVLFSELCESNRRRILLDPSSKIFQLPHSSEGTSIASCGNWT